jgi:hypothetical protein
MYSRYLEVPSFPLSTAADRRPQIEDVDVDSLMMNHHLIISSERAIQKTKAGNKIADIQ